MHFPRSQPSWIQVHTRAHTGRTTRKCAHPRPCTDTLPTGPVMPALWIECGTEEQRVARPAPHHADMRARRARNVTKACPAVQLTSVREEKDGNWNVRFQAIRECPCVTLARHSY